MLKNYFLFKELTKRDFKRKYKRTVLGMGWSVLSPLLNLLVLVMVFKRLLGRNTEHYVVFVFCGTVIMSYFRESTRGGMRSLIENRGIISTINVPKFLFLLSNNVSSLINFLLTLSVFFVVCIFDGIKISWNYIFLLIPIFNIVIFNIGVGFILSTLYVFFRDAGYIYDILLTIINYVSAVFYKIDSFPPTIQKLFLCNPLYIYIHYFRMVVIDGRVPNVGYHILGLLYSIISIITGLWFYKKYNYKFIYYL